MKHAFLKKRNLPSQTVMIPIIIVVFIVLVMQANWTRQNRPLLRSFLRGLEKISCQNCRGTGTIMDTEDEAKMKPVFCPVCFGVGFRYVRRENDNDKICPACGGLGRLQDMDSGHYRTCNRCDGRGLIKVRRAGERKPGGDLP